VLCRWMIFPLRRQSVHSLARMRVLSGLRRLRLDGRWGRERSGPGGPEGLLTRSFLNLQERGGVSRWSHAFAPANEPIRKRGV